MACINVRSISSKRGCFTLKSMKVCKRARRSCASVEYIIDTPHSAGWSRDSVQPGLATLVSVDQERDSKGSVREAGVLQNHAVAGAQGLHRAPVFARTVPEAGR